jgi:hypothetical protein
MILPLPPPHPIVVGVEVALLLFSLLFPKRKRRR